MLTFYDKTRNILNFTSEKSFITGPILDQHNLLIKKELSDSEYANFYEKLDFQSSDKKLFIVLANSYYHAVVDTLLQILEQHQKDKEIIFIISVDKEDTESRLGVFYNFFIKTLVENKIKHEIVYITNRTVLIIDNFYQIVSANPTSKGLGLVLDVIEKYRKNKDIEPYRKVFIAKRSDPSRNNRLIYVDENDKKNFDFTDDERLDDYEILSKYLSSIGFETIYAEDFDSFEKQIEYFDTVKILVSPTSAGLINLLLMRPNQIVVELEVPLVASGKQTLHSLYQGVAFGSGHLYMLIPTMRKSKEIIDRISSNKKLLEMLSE
jgi:hypothetical protein